MRKGFTFMEVVIVVIILSIILSLVVVHYKGSWSYVGQTVQVNGTNVRGVVVSVDTQTTPFTLLIRVDHGPTATPRYTEMSATRGEVTIVPPQVER